MPPQTIYMTRAEYAAWNEKITSSRKPDVDEAIDKALFDEENPLSESLFRYYRSTGKRFWCLCPRSVSVVKLADAGSIGETSDSDIVYKAVIDCLLLKRSA